MGKETKEQALRVGPCKLRLSLKVAMLLIDVIALQLPREFQQPLRVHVFLRPSTSEGQPCLPEAPELLSAIELLKPPTGHSAQKMGADGI